MALGTIERLTGGTFLADLSEFLASFEGMYEGFQRRADEVSRLLASPETTFLLVTVPLPEPITEADFFWRALRERDLPFGGVVVNKVHPSYVGGPPRHPRARPPGAARGRRARAGGRPRRREPAPLPAPGRPRPREHRAPRVVRVVLEQRYLDHRLGADARFEMLDVRAVAVGQMLEVE